MCESIFLAYISLLKLLKIIELLKKNEKKYIQMNIYALSYRYKRYN